MLHEGADAALVAYGPVMLHEALTGDVPFRGPLMQVLFQKQHERPAPPIARVPSVPIDLNDLCLALLDPDPDRRPAGAALTAAIARVTVPPRAPGARAIATSSLPFVGREQELGQLALAFEEALSADEPVVVLVQGESGLGKTALVRAFRMNSCCAVADMASYARARGSNSTRRPRRTIRSGISTSSRIVSSGIGSKRSRRIA